MAEKEGLNIHVNVYVQDKQRQERAEKDGCDEGI
jgi:hypothetical protein